MKTNLSKVLLTALLGCASLAFTESLVAQQPDAVFGLMYSGTTVGSPTFNRPNANGDNPPTTISGSATAVPFDVVQFSIATTGTYTFSSQSVSPPSWDNYTFLYSNSFDPANPLNNVLIGNDNNPSIGTSGFNFNLQTGVNYFFVTTGFSNSSQGSFNNSVTLVPEPASWALMALGVVGLLALQRTRRLAAR